MGAFFSLNRTFSGATGLADEAGVSRAEEYDKYFGIYPPEEILPVGCLENESTVKGAN